jgi:hypothetical protein
MAYTALTLITRAYYLSQVISRDLQLPSSSQIEDGLYLLNAILDFKSTDLRLIPYFTHYEFPTVINQELYFIPNLLMIDTMTFNIGDVRYSMYETSRFEYFGTPRVDNISNLPFSYRAERILEGMNIYMYFLPGGVYTVKIEGKFGLLDVFLNTDLSQIYDLYYIEYLRYELCNYICSEWGATMPDQAYKKYEELRKKLMEVSPKDLSIRKQSYFDGQSPIDWQYVNIGVGWLPF